MNKEKNKNIFDNFSFNQNNISVKNIISNFGNRIIDIYMHFQVKATTELSLCSLKMNGRQVKF